MYYRRSSYLPENVQLGVYPVLASTRSSSYGRPRYGNVRNVRNMADAEIKPVAAPLMQASQGEVAMNENRMPSMAS